MTVVRKMGCHFLINGQYTKQNVIKRDRHMCIPCAKKLYVHNQYFSAVGKCVY